MSGHGVEKPVGAAKLQTSSTRQAGRDINEPASENWRSARARACARACRSCGSGSAVYSSMAQRSKHTVEEAGFDISVSETSLIQYFRWRNRAGEQLLNAAAAVAESRRDSSPAVAELKWEYIASGRTPSFSWDFHERFATRQEVTASAEVLWRCEGSTLSEG